MRWRLQLARKHFAAHTVFASASISFFLSTSTPSCRASLTAAAPPTVARAGARVPSPPSLRGRFASSAAQPLHARAVLRRHNQQERQRAGMGGRVGGGGGDRVGWKTLLPSSPLSDSCTPCVLRMIVTDFMVLNFKLRAKPVDHVRHARLKTVSTAVVMRGRRWEAANEVAAAAASTNAEGGDGSGASVALTLCPPPSAAASCGCQAP